MEGVNSAELRRRNHNANPTSVLDKFTIFASLEKKLFEGCDAP